MQRLRSRLPPVNTLVVFEAAVRHLSFTKAGAELGVTREAVSRQIRSLERHLGRALFVRHHRALTLTVAGEQFGEVVGVALENVAKCAQAITEDGIERVTVTATIAIASFWLTPKLPSFRRLHPGTEIRVVVSDPMLDMAHHGIDLGLRYGDGNWHGVDSVRLFGVASAPVCSPSYLQQHAPMSNPENLTAHTLLNLDGAIHGEEDWAWWLRGVGVAPERLKHLDIVGFDNYANVIQAALDGQGVALGFSGIVDGLVEQQRLLRPVEAVLNPGHAVYLVRPQKNTLSASAQHFYDWVCNETHV